MQLPHKVKTGNMAREHTVKSFEQELRQLEKTVLSMGEMTLSQMERAFRAIENRDGILAQSVMDQKARIKELETQVDTSSVRMLALRQPMAVDLRQIVSSIRIAVDLERISDYSVSIARKIEDLPEAALEGLLQPILTMEKLVTGMLRDVLDAYLERRSDKAGGAWQRDREVDTAYEDMLQELRDLMRRDPDLVRACTSLLFISKSIERMGDHVTNIAEQVHYMIDGTPLRRVREAGRSSCFPEG